jgi:hypothetical protein
MISCPRSTVWPSQVHDPSPHLRRGFATAILAIKETLWITPALETELCKLYATNFMLYACSLIASTDSAFDVVGLHVCGTRVDVMGCQVQAHDCWTRESLVQFH